LHFVEMFRSSGGGMELPLKTDVVQRVDNTLMWIASGFPNDQRNTGITPELAILPLKPLHADSRRCWSG
jgi:hypothetical protein